MSRDVSSVHDTVYASVIEDLWGSEEAKSFLDKQGRGERALQGAKDEPKKEPGFARSLARSTINRGFGDVVRRGGSGVGKQQEKSDPQMEAD